MNKLIPCPFCGGKAETRSRYIGYGSLGLGAHDWYTVECTECRAKSNEYGDESVATAAWNRRADGKDTNVPTNAQRIRGMSDEELARWLVDATVCERVCGEDEYCHGNECVKRVTDWLQQPAKEEHHEAD